MDNKIKHLEFIQGIISRMSGNSFALKGWSVTLVAGLFALASKNSNKLYFIVTYIPIIVFWWLDAYYLLQERLYRSLYDKIRKANSESIDFSMDTSLAEFHEDPNTFFDCWKSTSVIGFYLPLALISAIVIMLSIIFEM